MVRFATDPDPRNIPAALRHLTAIVEWKVRERGIEALPHDPVF
jgi:hypothetical protein